MVRLPPLNEPYIILGPIWLSRFHDLKRSSYLACRGRVSSEKRFGVRQSFLLAQTVPTITYSFLCDVAWFFMHSKVTTHMKNSVHFSMRLATMRTSFRSWICSSNRPRWYMVRFRGGNLTISWCSKLIWLQHGLQVSYADFVSRFRISLKTNIDASWTIPNGAGHISQVSQI